MATRIRVVFFLAVGAALTWTIPCLAAGDKTTSDAKALFEAKCSVCHPSDRPKSKKKTKEEWEKTVTRMIKVNGCSVTDEEAKIIVEYLSKHYGP